MAVVLLPFLASLVEGPAPMVFDQPCGYTIEVAMILDVPASQLSQPICVHIGELPNVPSVVVSFEQQHSDRPLCIETVGKGDPICQKSGTTKWVSPPLFPPTQRHDYIFKINPDPNNPPAYAPVTIEVAPDASYAPSPPLPPGHHAPPPPTPRECDELELNALAVCAGDAIDMGCDLQNRETELTCLDKRQVHLHTRCRNAMAMLDTCLNQPPMLLPMEIASAMLLVTASFTLLCTILRCCCRRFCAAPVGGASHPAVSLEEPTELSDASEDEEHNSGASGQGSTGGAAGGTASATTSTRGASAVKGGKAPAAGQKAVAPAAAEEDEHDDQLPAYTQVVEHSSLVVQPLQCGSSATIN